MYKDAKGGNLRIARNFAYLACGLTWAFAGLDGALSKELNEFVFAWAAKIGAIFLLLALCLDLARRFHERETLEKMFEAKKVTRGEVAEAREFSKKFLPDVPPIEQLQEMFEASRGCVWFVNKCNFGFGLKKTERVGFFSLLRLTAAALPLCEANNLNSFQMNRTHIAGPRKSAPGLYVGGLGADGFRARGWLVQYLRSRIDQFFEQGGRVVYTRPVTDEGLRLANSLGFVPAVSAQQGLKNIYKLNRP